MITKNLVFYFLVISTLIFSLTIAGCANKPRYDTFAQCLAEKDITMYGTEWCSHCKNQKAMFGKSFQYIDYVDCDKYSGECAKAGVKGYPTWVIDGQNYPGEQQLYRLAQLSECELVEDE